MRGVVRERVLRGLGDVVARDPRGRVSGRARIHLMDPCRNQISIIHRDPSHDKLTEQAPLSNKTPGMQQRPGEGRRKTQNKSRRRRTFQVATETPTRQAEASISRSGGTLIMSS